jgi:c(7)-type cytochrome triheme protein
MKNNNLFLFVVCLLFTTAIYAESFGTKKREPKPEEYGNVVINNFSKDARIAPVEFQHWLHRAKYTCRLCHVDLGFAMVTGETMMREADNQNGLYCGACHDGKRAFTVKQNTKDKEDRSNCNRCHSVGLDIKPEQDFHTFVEDLPPSRFGNRVDWLKAEQKGQVKLIDYIKGISIKRTKLKTPQEFEMDAEFVEMPDILFSHEKHTVWNGCELCHPQIFNIRKSSTVFDMQDIFEGKYCGACHGKVAFTNMDCQLCHTKSPY